MARLCAAKRTTRAWKEAVDSLKVYCPTAYPVEVSRCKMPKGELGDCGYKSRRFKIRVSRSEPFDFQLWILAHEWAHALVWPIPVGRDSHHGEYFGIAFSKTLRAIYDNW